LPLFIILAIHHVCLISCLPVVFSQMVGILQDEFDWSVPPEAANSKVKPIFSVAIQADVSVSLDLYGERGGGYDVGTRYISAWEAAVDNNVAAESEIVAIRVPCRLLLFVLRSLSHPI